MITFITTLLRDRASAQIWR